MTVKDGVDISQLHPKLRMTLNVLDGLWRLIFPEDTDGLNITSGHEETSQHCGKSRHYLKNCQSGYGEAFDCRVKDVPQSKAMLAGAIIWQVMLIRGISIVVLPEGFLTDSAHLHIQL